MGKSEPKIFGIGLSKTGTTSLANALQILGYRVRDNMGVVRYAKEDLSSIDMSIVESFDALTDTPIPSFYRELDARFPGSKFILTVRDAQGWLKSCKKQFTQRFADVQTDAHKRLFVDLYGTDAFEERGFARGYERFVSGVREYFKDRPGDLLVIDVTAGEGWYKLCAFLGKPVPEIPFPKANVTRIRWMTIDEIVAVARNGGTELMRRYEGANRSATTAIAAKGAALTPVGEIIRRAVRNVLHGDVVRGAVRASNRAIVDGLTRLNPQIPVLSRAAAPVAYGARKDWNHFWLVDPLDGEGAFANGNAAFSIDVALIEDGVPIYGVVYAPATETIYYGATGKGAYLRERSGDPVRLGPGSVAPWSADASIAASAAPINSEESSRALAMCGALFGGAAGSAAVFAPSMEWHTAAAHAVLSCAGMNLRENQSRKPVGYNKTDLVHGRIRIESTSLEGSE